MTLAPFLGAHDSCWNGSDASEYIDFPSPHGLSLIWSLRPVYYLLFPSVDSGQAQPSYLELLEPGMVDFDYHGHIVND